MISGAPSSSKRFSRLLRLMTRRYRSLRSLVAKRPPSSCTIGRKSGGRTGSIVITIHSGRLPDLRKASTTRSRFVAFFLRCPELDRVSPRSSVARSSRLIVRSRSRTASAPMPALKIRPHCSISSRYSASLSVCRGLIHSIFLIRSAAASRTASGFMSAACLISAAFAWTSARKRSISASNGALRFSASSLISCSRRPK